MNTDAIAMSCALSALLMLVDCSNSARVEPNSESVDDSSAVQYEAFIAATAAAQSWSDDYALGQEIADRLSNASINPADSVDITAYRGQHIARGGSGAPPGATNDLISTYGIYIRIVNPDRKDLRPHAATWTVLVHGKILQVLHRMIILEVSEEDWIILEAT